MKEFSYIITHPLGIHARPASQLVRQAGQYVSVCTITRGAVTRKLTQLMMLMAMGIKAGDEVTVRAEGEDEEQAILALEDFFRANL